MRVNEQGLIYGLEDRPPFGMALLAGFQHLLAIFVGIITPTLVLGAALGFQAEVPYLISMSLIISGVATWIQCHRLGPVGSGLLSIQGTSFAFVGCLLIVGHAARDQGLDTRHVLGLIFGMCLVGSTIEMVLSLFLVQLRRILAPVVTGLIVLLIGLSLVRVAVVDMGGGAALLARDPTHFGAPANLALGLFVLVLVMLLNRSRWPLVRMGAIMLALFAGYALCIALGRVSFAGWADQPLVSVPVPFKYGLGFDWHLFPPIAFLYLIITLESVGDLTATSLVSNEPVEGPLYLRRLRTGVLGDGVNSALASVFNTFPNTTFCQNNGVIQLTGVASRHVGLYIAGLLVVLGLFPVIGEFFARMPPPVLGGATLVMFGTVAASGLKIVAAQPLDRRNLLIIAVTLGVGLGVQVVPQVLSQLPDAARHFFGSSITTGGITAMLAHLLLPGEKDKASPPA